MLSEGKLHGIAIREASRAAMRAQQQVEVSVARGLIGDYRGTGLRQVTFLDAAQWQEAMQELDTALPWHTRRANLLIAGFELPSVVGCRLQIGTCVFIIHGETEPCQRMDELHPGLRQTLVPDLRGGVWGRVLEGGSLQVGQTVQVLP
jgi:MOSC domain-containing protein YiiM